jgi:hypothetical protein
LKEHNEKLIAVKKQKDLEEEKKLYPIVVKQFQTNVNVNSNQSNDNVEKSELENSRESNASSSINQNQNKSEIAPLPVVVNSTKIKIIKKSKHVVDPKVEGSSKKDLSSSLDDANLNITRYKAKNHSKTHSNTISIIQDDTSKTSDGNNDSKT